MDYNDGSSQFRVSDSQTLTFFTASLKVEADEVEDAEVVTLGKSLKLTAEFVPDDLDVDRIRYTSSFRHEHNFHVLHDSDENDVFEYDDFARIAGFFNLRLSLHYHDGLSVAVHTSDTEELEVQFPSYQEIVEEGPTEVFERKWDDTLAAATPEIWREYGGWILYNSVTLEYSVDPREGDEVEPPHEVPRIDEVEGEKRPETVPAESLLNPASNGAIYAVGFFHTHPPLTHIASYFSRLVGESGGDSDFHNDPEIQVPGVIYDYEATHNAMAQLDPPPLVRIIGGHELDADKKPYPTGPDRRPTPQPEEP